MLKVISTTIAAGLLVAGFAAVAPQGEVSSNQAGRISCRCPRMW